MGIKHKKKVDTNKSLVNMDAGDTFTIIEEFDIPEDTLFLMLDERLSGNFQIVNLLSGEVWAFDPDIAVKTKVKQISLEITEVS